MYQVEGITVDWLAGNVYWTDSLYNWIAVAPAKGDSQVFHVLIDSELDHPSGIAIYPQKGLLLWSDRGTLPRIEMSSCAGKGRTTLVQVNITLLNIIRII